MGSKQSSQSNTAQTYTPPANVMAQYNAVTNQAQSVAATPYSAFNGELVAPVNSQQNTGIAATNAASGIQNGYNAGATGLTAASAATINPTTINAADIQQYESPYNTDVVNATEAELQNQNQQQQTAIQGNAISAGAFGGDRAGIAQAALAGQQDLAADQTIASLNNQNYEQALTEANTQQATGLSAAQNTAARQLAAGSQLGTLGNTAQTEALTEANAQVNAGTFEQQTQQAQDTAAYNQYLQAQAYPFETTGWLANIVEGIGSQSGGTTTGQTTTDTSALSSILGGAAGLGSLLLPSKKSGGRIVHRAVGGGLGGAITPYAATTGVFDPTASQPANTGVGGGTWVPAGPLSGGHSNMPTRLNPAGGGQQAQTPLQSAQTMAATAKGFQGLGTGISNGFTALAPDSVNDAIQDAGDFARGGVPHRGIGGLVPPGAIRPQMVPRSTGLMPASMAAQHFAGGGLVIGDGGFMQRPHFDDGGNVSPADALMADPDATAPTPSATGLVPSRTPSPKVADINDLVFNPNSDAVPLVNPVFQGPTPNPTPVNTGLSTSSTAPTGLSAPAAAPSPTVNVSTPQVADVGNALPRGLRNNNPGNLVDNPWTQSLPGYTGSDGRFATFDSPQSGTAALDRNLQNYASKGITTPLQIANRWAPASDSNDPVTYAHFIAKQAGVGIDQPIDMTDPAMRAKVGAAISRFENGASSPTGIVTGRSASMNIPANAIEPTGPVPPQQQDSTGGPLDSIEHAVTGIGAGGGGLLPRGSLGGFGISDSERMGLLAAGLGMMSGTSKNPMINIGQGGLTGLRAMQENTQNQAKTGLLRQQTQTAEMNNQILKQKLEWMHGHLSQQQKENQAKAEAASSTTASPASITAPTITASPNQTSFNQELLAHQKEAEGAAIIGMPELQKFHQDQIDRALNVGRGVDARGNIVGAPGYNDAVAATEAAKETAKRSAAAPYELQEVQPTPGGPTQYVPKSQLLNLQKTNPDATPVGIGAGSPPGGGASALAANNPLVAKQPAFIAERQKQIADNENQMVEQFQGRQIARQRLQDISKILETYQTGKFAEQKAELVSTLKSIGIPVPKSATANPAAFEQFMKDTTAGIFDQAKSLGGRILVTELAGLGKSNANPAMQPEANRAIIGQALGLLDYEDQHSRDYFDWKRQNPYAYDPSQFEMDWVSKHPVKSYVEGARAETPARGEEIPAADQRKAGQVYMTPKGKMRWMGNGWSREP